MKKIRTNNFRDITTFRVGGEIGAYAELKDKSDVEWAVKEAKKRKLKMFILGDGSDILASDANFDNFVIRYTGKKYHIKDSYITAEAGMKWDDMVDLSVKNNLQGIECLSGIPGTVGAAPIQNIGAYGQELKDTFVSLEAFDIDKGEFVTFDKESCRFGYRESIFKEKSHWQKYIIVSVTLGLNKNAKPVVTYESLQIKNNPSLTDVRNSVLKVRREKLEDPGKIGNAGSFFKNPIVNLEQKNLLEKKFSGIKIYPFGDEFKISAAWLIEKAGWKGKTYKGAGVSSKHALVLINVDGHAKAEDILKLSEMIIDDVYKKFGVKLEREVQLINF